jgi:hypothetical protein
MKKWVGDTKYFDKINRNEKTTYVKMQLHLSMKKSPIFIRDFMIFSLRSRLDSSVASDWSHGRSLQH